MSILEYCTTAENSKSTVPHPCFQLALEKVYSPRVSVNWKGEFEKGLSFFL